MPNDQPSLRFLRDWFARGRINSAGLQNLAGWRAGRRGSLGTGKRHLKRASFSGSYATTRARLSEVASLEEAVQLHTAAIAQLQEEMADPLSSAETIELYGKLCKLHEIARNNLSSALARGEEFTWLIR
jgi:hypothetical protein